MATWHVVLYSAAAVFALRSFIQLMTNHRNEYEHVAVSDHLARMAEELEAQKAKDEAETAPAEQQTQAAVA